MEFEIGNSVIVKQGVKEPDLEEFEIGAWQGRIIEIDTKSDKNNTLITIEWDSITLKRIPPDYIEQSEREGYDWKNMVLYASELEKTTPRDKKENVKKTHAKLSDKHYWDSLGDEGKRISKILDKVNPHNEMKSLQKWVEHLDEKLTFPIQAIVSNSEDDWLIKSGDKILIKSLPHIVDMILIKSLPHIVDMYGIIASIKLEGKKYDFPLCDIEVVDKSKADYQLINDYRTWFANR